MHAGMCYDITSNRRKNKAVRPDERANTRHVVCFGHTKCKLLTSVLWQTLILRALLSLRSQHTRQWLVAMCLSYFCSIYYTVIKLTFSAVRPFTLTTVSGVPSFTPDRKTDPELCYASSSSIGFYRTACACWNMNVYEDNVNLFTRPAETICINWTVPWQQCKLNSLYQ